MNTTARFFAFLVIAAGLLAPPSAGRGDASSGSGTFTDPRDGQTYGWVRIGEQVWMAENLRYATKEGSWCWENDPAECARRGRFYNWEAACRAAPPGWHLPSDDEWKTLEMSLGLTAKQTNETGVDRGGETNTAGGCLKKVGGWPTEYEGRPIEITNTTGFSAIPSGLYARETFFHEGYAVWWTNSASGDKAWCHSLRFFDNKIGRDENDRAFAFPVRCVRDEPSETRNTGGTGLSGPYLGQTPPVEGQVLFAPGIVSTDAGNHSSVAITPDGAEFYWEARGKIWFSKLENDVWTGPEMLAFCSGDSYAYGNPFIAPGGQRMFYTSFRPGAVAQDKETIWYVERTPGGWSQPEPVGAAVNSVPLHWSISVSGAGTLYFQFQDTTGKSPGGIGDIYCSRLVDGAYAEPEEVGPAINTRHTETCPYIAPDESYLIFNRFDHTDMKNSGIFISFRDESGRWLPARFVVGGSPDRGGISPKISPDGRYLFFANGSDGMWWMPAGFVEEMRPGG